MQAWDMVTSQLRHDLAGYKTIPLSGIAIIKAVLKLRSTYRGLFLDDTQRMAQWDHIHLQYLRDTPGVEPRLNRHRITTDLRDGGMGLRWACGSLQARTKPTKQGGLNGSRLPPNIST